MTAYLLDVNVLLALSWPGHKAHETAQRWFNRSAGKGWATCPMVEAGFVRILSNPAFSPRAVTAAEAIRALTVNVKHPAHQFWPDDVSVADGLSELQTRITGHLRVTDAYLLALAIRNKGKLATLDKGVLALAEPPARPHVELIG
jgi:uncharacterized protein